MRIETAGRATFGMPFRRGDLPFGRGLSLNGETVQVDAKTFYSDGSVRWAVLTADGAGTLELATPVGESLPRQSAEPVWVGDVSLDFAHTGTWLNGPLVRQDCYEAAIGALRVLQYVGSDERLFLTFHNTSGREIAETAKCRGWSGKVALGAYAKWVKPFGTNGSVRRDVAYLISTGAVDDFDTELEVDVSGLRGVDVGPMQAPLNFRKMPTTGQTAGNHVGMMPPNFVAALLSQDPGALDWCRSYSFGAASIGWHYHPFPQQPLDEAKRTERKVNGNGWTVDRAHQPAFHYLPALLTGDKVHLDLQQEQANGGVLFFKRMHPLRGQVRAAGWGMRTLAEAAYLTPDDDPLKAYFVDHLNRAIADFRKLQWNEVGETQGFNWRARTNPGAKGNISPWMDDYFTLAMCRLYRMGFDVRHILDFKANYVAGRHSEHPGYPAEQGVTYYQKVATKENRLIFGQEWRDTIVRSPGGRPNRAGHYHDVATGAAWAIARILQTEPLYQVAERMYARMVTEGGAAERRKNPKWAIAPRRADGSEQPPVEPPVIEPPEPPTPEEKAYPREQLLAIASNLHDRIASLPERVPESDFADLVEDLMDAFEAQEPIDELDEEPMTDQIEKAAAIGRLNAAIDDVNALTETTVGAAVGVERDAALPIVAAAEADIVAMPVLTEDPPPPPPPDDWVNLLAGDLLFGEVEGQAPVGAGTVVSKVDIGRIDPTRRFMTRPGGLLIKTPGFDWPAFTVELDNFLLDINESSFFSLTFDENAARSGPYFDWQFGGSLATLGAGTNQYANHLHLNGGNDEQNPASRGGLAGQWSRRTLVSDAAGTRVHINGEPTGYTHPYNGGLVSNALIAVQFHLTGKSSRWQASHPDNRSYTANLRIKAGADDEATIRARYQAAYSGLADHIRGDLPGVTLPKQTVLDNNWATINSGDNFWTPTPANRPLANVPAW